MKEIHDGKVPTELNTEEERRAEIEVLRIKMEEEIKNYREEVEKFNREYRRSKEIGEDRSVTDMLRGANAAHDRAVSAVEAYEEACRAARMKGIEI